MKKIDVTVIIPYYKSHLTIERAINSILNQTMMPQEIIIIDDCSATLEDNLQLKELSKNSLINVIKLDRNYGPGTARNKGIDRSITKYIAFLDSDDTWEKTKLEVQYKVMERENADITSHKTAIYNKKYNYNSTGLKYKKISKFKFLYKNTISTRSVMMKRKLPNRFLENKKRSEDFLLWAEILFSNFKALHINNTLAHSYKAPYGESGLTKNLKLMHFGKIESLKILKHRGYINNLNYFTATFYEKLKYKNRIFRNYIK